MSEPLQNLQQLDQDYQAVLAALRDEKNRQISEYQAQAWKMAQRASKAEAERDALQARVDALEKKNEINALFEPRKTKEEGYDPNKPVWRDGW